RAPSTPATARQPADVEASAVSGRTLLQTRVRRSGIRRPSDASASASVHCLERELQIGSLVARKLDRVVARVARRAVSALLRADRSAKALQAQVREAVGFDVFADFLDRMRRRDELGAVWRVDAVETGRNRRRTADAEMHFTCAGSLDHSHDLPAGGAADDRVVDQDDAAVLEDAADRIQLHLDAEMP